MHVLIIPSWYVSVYNPISGIFFKEQAEALVKYGHQVGLIAVQEIGIRNIVKEKKIVFPKEYELINGVHTYRKSLIDFKLKTLKQKLKLKLFKLVLERYIKERGVPKIVHLHSYMAGNFVLYIKEKYKIPYVVTEHSSSFARNLVSIGDKHNALKLFENSSANIAVSEKLGKFLNEEFSQKFTFIPNIVDVDFFSGKEESNAEIFQFINIAFLDKNKNQDMLIRSFAHSFKKNGKLKLLIVGAGKEYSRLKDLIIKLDMDQYVILHGKADRQTVKSLLQQSDAFVLSSQYETFGVVLIEAMSCGLPVVSTKCGGPESIVTSPELGKLCEITKESLSQKMLQLYNEREIYDADFIRDYAIKHFSESAVCQQLTKIYQQAIA